MIFFSIRIHECHPLDATTFAKKSATFNDYPNLESPLHFKQATHRGQNMKTFFALTFGTLTLCTMILHSSAKANETPTTRYVCAARVDCGSPRLPSTQDLPTVKTPTVQSRTPAEAREQCLATHSSAYARLARGSQEISPKSLFSESRGCKIVSEAFPADSPR